MSLSLGLSACVFPDVRVGDPNEHRKSNDLAEDDAGAAKQDGGRIAQAGEKAAGGAGGSVAAPTTRPQQATTAGRGGESGAGAGGGGSGAAAGSKSIAGAGGRAAAGTPAATTDPCDTNNGGCSAMAACDSRAGGAPVCTCRSGFSGNGMGANGCTSTMAPAEPPRTNTRYSWDEDTVTDSSTDLTWQRIVPMSYAPSCSTEYGTNKAGVNGCNWDDAKTYCANLTLASGGWHLPSSAELVTVVDRQYDSLIDPVAFPNALGESFWTSTANTAVNFNKDLPLENLTNNVSAAFGRLVRCVR